MDYKWLYKIKYAEPDMYMQTYAQRYNGISTYHYDFLIKDKPAFVVVTPEILRLKGLIQALDKKLLLIEGKLPLTAVQWFTRKCLVDEVKQTNELEGVASTRREIIDVLKKRSDKNNRLYGIVQKYLLLNTSYTIPYSTCRDIRILYDEFVHEEIKQSDSRDLPDGEIFRKEAVYVRNASGDVIHEGLMPESEIISSMSLLLAALNNQAFDPLINIAVFHYMFGYIHPFYDGNGRMSRFISSYLLSKELEPIVGYRLAYTIKKDIQKYHKMFKLTNEAQNLGDLTPFTIYFLELIEDCLKELISSFSDSAQRLGFYMKKVESMSEPEDYKELLTVLMQNTMFGIQGLSVQELCEILHKSQATVRKKLKLMENEGLLLIENGRPILYDINLDKI